MAESELEETWAEQIRERCAEFSEPVLLYDVDGIRESITQLSECASVALSSEQSVGIRFALKANRYLPVLREISAAGHGFDVASMAEFDVARSAGNSPISATSPGFDADDVLAFLRAGAELNVDNFAQLAAVPAGSAVGIRIKLPLTSGSNPRDDPFSRFGLDMSDSGSRRRLLATQVRVERIQGHTRNVANSDDLRSLVESVVEAASLFPDVRQINLGGGMTRLHSSDADARSAWFACRDLLGRLSESAEVLLEPGAQIISGHGYLGTRVVSVSRADGGRQICVVDSSRWNLVSWSSIALVWPPACSEGIATDIVGPTCYENDLWQTRIRMPELRVGDLIVFSGLGAYVSSMCRNLHALHPPREALLSCDSGLVRT